MSILKFNPEHSPGKYADDFTFGYDRGVCWRGRRMAWRRAEICLNQTGYAP
jgi:hypothetical protein